MDFLKWVEETHSIQDDTKVFYRHGWHLLSATKLAEVKLDAIQGHDCDTTTFPGGPCHANHALRTLRRMLSLARQMKKLYRDPGAGHHLGCNPLCVSHGQGCRASHNLAHGIVSG